MPLKIPIMAALASETVVGRLGWRGVATATYFKLIQIADEIEFLLHPVLEIRIGRPTASAPFLTEAPARQPSLGPRFLFR